MDWSIDPSIDWSSTHLPTNQITHQAIKQPTNLPTLPPTNQPIKECDSPDVLGVEVDNSADEVVPHHDAPNILPVRRVLSQKEADRL